MKHLSWQSLLLVSLALGCRSNLSTPDSAATVPDGATTETAPGPEQTETSTDSGKTSANTDKKNPKPPVGPSSKPGLPPPPMLSGDSAADEAQARRQNALAVGEWQAIPDPKQRFSRAEPSSFQSGAGQILPSAKYKLHWVELKDSE